MLEPKMQGLEVNSAAYRLEAALWKLVFECAYGYYVPLPAGCPDYYEFGRRVLDWYEEDSYRSCERCPLILTEDGYSPGFADPYMYDCGDWQVLRQVYDNEALLAKWWAKNNLQLLIEVYGNESAN